MIGDGLLKGLPHLLLPECNNPDPPEPPAEPWEPIVKIPSVLDLPKLGGARPPWVPCVLRLAET